MVSTLDMGLEELIGLMFVLIFLVSLWMFLPGAVIEGSARANTFELAKSINTACFLNAKEDNPIILENFALPQWMPGGKLSKIISIIPEYKMSTTGDPNYVIYYEMFPPGEALSWEIFQSSLGHRSIVYIDDEADTNSDGKISIVELEKFIEEKKETYDQYITASIEQMVDEFNKNNIEGVDSFEVQDSKVLNLDGILVANIRITDDIDPFSAGLRSIKENQGNLNKLGEWENDKGTSGTPFFRFSNYLGLSVANKSLVKYMSCGNNKLCMKTPDGILAFPINSCETRGIDYIQWDKKEKSMEDDKSDVTEFYTASPCSYEEIKIYVDECEVPKFCHQKITVPLWRWDTDADRGKGALVKEQNINGSDAEYTKCVNVALNLNPDKSSIPSNLHGTIFDPSKEILKDNPELNGNPILNPVIESPDGTFKCLKIETTQTAGHCKTNFEVDEVWRSAYEHKKTGLKIGVGVAATVCGVGIVFGPFSFGASTIVLCGAAAVGIAIGAAGGIGYVDDTFFITAKDTPMRFMVYYLEENNYLLKPPGLLQIPGIDIVGLKSDLWIWP